jgi:hypothetical protein
MWLPQQVLLALSVCSDDNSLEIYLDAVAKNFYNLQCDFVMKSAAAMVEW